MVLWRVMPPQLISPHLLSPASTCICYCCNRLVSFQMIPSTDFMKLKHAYATVERFPRGNIVAAVFEEMIGDENEKNIPFTAVRKDAWMS
jgi:hypothetical protein